MSTTKIRQQFDIPTDVKLVALHNYPGYFVSDQGYVYSACNGRTIRMKRGNETYKSVTLYRRDAVQKKLRKKEYVHRLVWMAFNEKPIPEGFEIDHIDKKPSNNALSNLRLITKSENIRRSAIGRRKTTARTVEIQLDGKRQRFSSVKEADKFLKANGIPVQARQCLSGYETEAKLKKYGVKISYADANENVRKWNGALEDAETAIREAFELQPEVELCEHPYLSFPSRRRLFADSRGELYRVTANQVERVKLLPNDQGYLVTSIKRKNYGVHRIVYGAFNGKRLDGVSINHKNRNRSDNAIDNLQISNTQHNNRHAHEKSVFLYRLDGEYSGKFESINECARHIDVTPSVISGIFTGKSFVLKCQYFATLTLVPDPKKHFTQLYLKRFKSCGKKQYWRYQSYHRELGHHTKIFASLQEVLDEYGKITCQLHQHVLGQYASCHGSIWLCLPPTLQFPEYHPRHRAVNDPDVKHVLSVIQERYGGSK